MFSRKIFAPALIIACKTSADSVAGPRVQMILVFRIRDGSGNAPRKRAGNRQEAAFAAMRGDSVRCPPGLSPELPRCAAGFFLRAGAQLEDRDGTRHEFDIFPGVVRGRPGEE